ncbi:CRP/FNR family transcriptional regulator, nitrogen fixation regulation protein [Sulfitobacter marinus]|uniref:CRP/FNR family transcriptional regulator, nitrogen fixation regulation protein n=1 Tax=Sulfitobacter marinus TaxID=394264 RepID=A0A1I6UJ34_9RHOB|nr:Crp/Fnr family transcriptional regulator [Sulfitobacter marinus]SFT01486.1 CRP/FNR family transcriptional regulator, nitrogen fixation regulation protein [Sulfitobacter marinus]
MTSTTASLAHAASGGWIAPRPKLVPATRGSATKINSTAPEAPNETTALLTLFRAHAFEQHFQPGSTVLLHGDTADAIYLVVSGTIRCCTVDSEGHRQIFSFSKKGEFVGISDMDIWHFTAEAVDHVILKSIPRSTLEQELAVNMSLRQEVRAYVRALLMRRERQMLTLIIAKGPDRLYQFLKEFAATRSGTGHVVLPMCRRDIGDHIGLSMEGVSRAFSRLKRQGLIDLKSHDRFKIVEDTDRTARPRPQLARA